MSRSFFPTVAAFLALPGIVAFILPLGLAYGNERLRVVGPIGLIVAAAGIALLLWCVREFYAVGRATLAPWAPPTRLVVAGPYRVSRNPMYVAVALILWGWALTFRWTPLAWYAVSAMVAFHLRVVLGEEPWLARTHGTAWHRYRARVPRWLGPARSRAAGHAYD